MSPGGFVPGPKVEIVLHPDECVIRPDGHGGWECVRNHVPREEWSALPHPARGTS